MTAKPHGAETGASRSAERDPDARRHDFGRNPSPRKSPQRLYFSACSTHDT